VVQLPPYLGDQGVVIRLHPVEDLDSPSASKNEGSVVA
jgi:hypothetical protein